jgi:hypothetical protein
VPMTTLLLFLVQLVPSARAALSATAVIPTWTSSSVPLVGLAALRACASPRCCASDADRTLPRMKVKAPRRIRKGEGSAPKSRRDQRSGVRGADKTAVRAQGKVDQVKLALHLRVR